MKKILLVIVCMMISCNACMRSSAETRHTFPSHLSVNVERNTLYMNLEKIEKVVIKQQKQVDSLISIRMKK